MQTSQQTSECQQTQGWSMTSCPCCGELEFGDTPWTCDECSRKARKARKAQAPVSLAVVAMLVAVSG